MSSLRHRPPSSKDNRKEDFANEHPSKATSKPNFHFDLWCVFTVENWVFDFGRPLFALALSEWFPRSLPSIGDYCHMAYNILTAFILLQLLGRSVRPVPNFIQQLLVIVFVMGASIHLVGESVNHRLIAIGYKNHLTVQENPIMQSLQPRALIHSFELLYFYDEFLGHELWYIPLFTANVILFYGCFTSGHLSSPLPVKAWLLLVPSALFEWYMVTEGQMFPLFLVMLTAKCLILLLRWSQGLSPDCNGRWLLYRSVLVLCLVCVWVGYLWNDPHLRKRYPELLYVPEPWSYVTLYVMK